MCLYDSSTFSNSSLRNKPLSTKMQYKFLPIALCNNTAAMLESTPPLKPNTTLSLPIFCFKLFTEVSTNESGVQFAAQPQIFKQKFFSKIPPSVEWYTSG